MLSYGNDNHYIFASLISIINLFLPICMIDFYSPNGTIFSQRHFVCVWWFEFDCSTAPRFYELNAELYKEAEARQTAGLIGGSVPSLIGHESDKLLSPKNNLNQLYAAQIDEFSGTTATPYAGYSNGKARLRNGNGNLKGTTQPIHYGVSAVDSVTPSSLDSQNFETTPYNLDEALGEEIHSETPLIESLSLTTNLPKINGAKSYGGKSAYLNYYNNKMTTLPDYSYGGNK